MMSEDGDGFQLVSRRKAARRMRQKPPNYNCSMPLHSSTNSEVDKADVLDRIQSCRVEILESDFWVNFLDTIKRAGFPAKEVEEGATETFLNGHVDLVTDELETKRQMHCVHNTAIGLCDSEGEHTGITPGPNSCGLLQTLPVDANQATANEQHPHPALHPKKNASFPDSHPSAPILEHSTGESEHHALDSSSRATIPKDEMVQNPICTALLEEPGKRAHMVCYGLGRFSTCHTARYQLAFFLALRDHFEVCQPHCHIYDPVFSEVETSLLAELGCTVIAFNEEGKRQVRDKTLFFMPHCGTPLYNNLLWANWTSNCLSCLSILGNSFANIESRTPHRLLKAEASFVAKILPHVTEHPVTNNFRYSDIFNELSIHSFNVPAEQKPSNFWTDAAEPVYPNNVEIIQKNSNRR